jgi:hypothetical protein
MALTLQPLPVGLLLKGATTPVPDVPPLYSLLPKPGCEQTKKEIQGHSTVIAQALRPTRPCLRPPRTATTFKQFSSSENVRFALPAGVAQGGGGK